MPGVQDLIQLAPPPGFRFAVDWETQREATGFTFPADYREIAERYGSGQFMGSDIDLGIWMPADLAADTDVGDIVSMGTSVAAIIDEHTAVPRREILKDAAWVDTAGNPRQSSIVDLVAHPLLGWGGDSAGMTGFWCITDPVDPDSWPVIFTDLRTEFIVEEGGLARLLVGLFTGHDVAFEEEDCEASREG